MSAVRAIDLSVDDLEEHLADWNLALRAAGRSPKTIRNYTDTLRQFAAFLRKEGLPTSAPDINHHHVRAFEVHVRETRSASTAATRHRHLHQLFKFLEEEEVIELSPMHKVKAPQVPEKLVPVISQEQFQTLLEGAKGTAFNQRRDTAILVVSVDTGCRVDELTKLQLDHYDRDAGTLVVTGKGNRQRELPIGVKAQQALNRYMKVRARHTQAELPWLWLGKKGRLTDNGVRQMLRRRAKAVGLEDIHPHRFRHTWAHEMLDSGVSEGDVLRLGGWKTRAMLERYGASAADARARRSHREHSPGDRWG